MQFIISDQLRLSVLNGELWVGLEHGRGITFKDPVPVLTLLIAFCHPMSLDQAPACAPSIEDDDIVMLCRLMADVGILQKYDVHHVNVRSLNLFADMRMILDLSDHPGPFAAQNHTAQFQKIAIELAELCLDPVLEPPTDVNAIDLKQGINFGCGSQPIPQWFNIDLKEEYADLKWDLRWPLPFPNNSVMRVNCSHVLEHLEPDSQVPAFLKEAVRIMTPGGKIRVIVPDALAWMSAYCKSDEHFFHCTGQQMGIDWGGGDRVRRILTYLGVRPNYCSTDHHRMGYDYSYLKEILLENGFNSVRKCNFNSSPDLEFRIDHFSRSAQVNVDGCHPSLFVEAQL